MDARPAETKLIPLMVRLPTEVHAWLRQQAKDENRSLNSQCITFLQQAMRATSPTSPAR